MIALSPSQQKVYDAIANFQNDNGYTPTLRVLGDQLSISQWTVAAHVRKIIEKGRARRVSSHHIELTG